MSDPLSQPDPPAPTTEPAPAPAPAPESPADVPVDDSVTRVELEDFKHRVAKSVRRLNRAVKEARRSAAETVPGEKVEPVPPKPAPAPQPPRRGNLERMGIGILDSCRRKTK